MHRIKHSYFYLRLTTAPPRERAGARGSSFVATRRGTAARLLVPARLEGRNVRAGRSELYPRRNHRRRFRLGRRFLRRNSKLGLGLGPRSWLRGRFRQRLWYRPQYRLVLPPVAHLQLQHGRARRHRVAREIRREPATGRPNSSCERHRMWQGAGCQGGHTCRARRPPMRLADGAPSRTR